MPDDTINIYIDATFSDKSAYTDDIQSEVTFVPADVIGAYNIPATFTTAASVSGSMILPVEYFRINYTVSGSTDTYVDIFVASVTTSGFEVCLLDYSTGYDTVSGTKITYIDYIAAGDDTTTSGFQPAYIDYIAGQLFSNFLDVDVPIDYWTAVPISGTEIVTTDYTCTAPINFYVRKTTDVSFGSYPTMTSGVVDKTVDVTFAGWANFPLAADLFCSLEDIAGIEFDITTISGNVGGIVADIHSAIPKVEGADVDVFCCLVDFEQIDSELTVVSGSVEKLDCHLSTGIVDVNSLGCDVDLLSLKISNFIPVADEYVFASEGISVDITDDIYNVLTVASGITCSGTCCLKVDGVAVPATFSGITDGYRMYYDPPAGFDSLGGSIEFLVRGENSNNDILEQSFYLTNGYFVDYANYPGRFDFGYENQILVRMSAEDLATCPKFSAGAYWFVTEHLKPQDLSASITGVPVLPLNDVKDLSASISPQSTAYFYGKVFRVVLTCRDFVGNEMEPYEFEFKIEDGPN